MIVLAFDTATLQGSIAWLRFSGEGPRPLVQEFAKISAPANPGHAETLLVRIEQLLSTGGISIADVDLVVFGRGPGTFTGLRIGLSTAKALTLCHDMPIVGISTLEATALSTGRSGTVVSLIDARRGELFAGAYKLSFENNIPVTEKLAPESVVKPNQVQSWLKDHDISGPILMAGNGAQRYNSLLEPVGVLLPEINSAPDAYYLGVRGVEIFHKQGGDDAASVEPVYLREPDAKLPSK